MPAVVSIQATSVGRDFFGRLVQETAQGTGFIFDRRGFIATNNHVVEGAAEVKVSLASGQVLDATIAGTDPQTDLAVIKVEPPSGVELTVAPIGDSTRVRPGDWVIAIGNALGFENTVTVGVVSAVGRSLQVATGSPPLPDLVQTDAVINPGNSGGPLLNLEGEVVGINTSIIRGTLPNGEQAEGIGFAISSDVIKPITRQLVEQGKVTRPSLGVSVMTVTPALAASENLSVSKGVLVVDPTRGGPAERGGVRSRDVILAVNGQEVSTVWQLQKLLLERHSADDQVTLTVARGDGRVDIPVLLG
ncbi:MAG: trypsin-like peptidase domain-containing protein [Chloroflexi bacterium]|nr:trypsin-like peptidase domain-containing protein [Chloroflexota bacterium]